MVTLLFFTLKHVSQLMHVSLRSPPTCGCLHRIWISVAYSFLGSPVPLTDLSPIKSTLGCDLICMDSITSQKLPMLDSFFQSHNVLDISLTIVISTELTCFCFPIKVLVSPCHLLHVSFFLTHSDRSHYVSCFGKSEYICIMLNDWSYCTLCTMIQPQVDVAPCGWFVIWDLLI